MNEDFTCECLNRHHYHQVRHRYCGDISDKKIGTWCICEHRRLPFHQGLVKRLPPLTTGRPSPGGDQDDNDNGDDHDGDDQGDAIYLISPGRPSVTRHNAGQD